MKAVLENASLKNYNTFGIDAKARFLIHITSADQLKQIINDRTLLNQKILVLGGGSNVLFTNDFDGYILINEIKGKEKINENKNFFFIQVAGGENWSEFVDYCVDRNWYGLENLSLIPGKVGAAPVQNIGAYGVEQRELMVSLQAMNLKTGKISDFKNKNCEFGYRSSIFKTKEKGNWFILNVTYQLKKTPAFNLEYGPLKAAFENESPHDTSLKDISETVKSIRMSKLPNPAITGNAGSFFKNPVVSKEKFESIKSEFPDMPFYEMEGNVIKIPAGWLIESCGWKGKTIGQAGVHEKQALVLINKGKATGTEILHLAKNIQADVLKNFNIELEPEVLIL